RTRDDGMDGGVVGGGAASVGGGQIGDENATRSGGAKRGDQAGEGEHEDGNRRRGAEVVGADPHLNKVRFQLDGKWCLAGERGRDCGVVERAVDERSRYGERVAVYEIRPGILKPVRDAVALGRAAADG